MGSGYWPNAGSGYEHLRPTTRMVGRMSSRITQRTPANRAKNETEEMRTNTTSAAMDRTTLVFTRPEWSSTGLSLTIDPLLSDTDMLLGNYSMHALDKKRQSRKTWLALFIRTQFRLRKFLNENDNQIQTTRFYYDRINPPAGLNHCPL